MPTTTKVLFICLGNICRSPIAEAVFLNEITKQGLNDRFIGSSAALGPWHVGKQPDKRAQATLKKHGIRYEHRARQVYKDDFENFDFIFGMDNENIIELNNEKPANCHAKIQLLGEYDPEGEKIIKDPYYDSGSDGFEKCYQQCVRSIRQFISECK